MRAVRAAKAYAREIIERCPRMEIAELETAYDTLSVHLREMEEYMSEEPPHKAVTRLLYARQDVSERLHRLRQARTQAKGSSDELQKLRLFFESCIDQLAGENHALRERVLALERGSGVVQQLGIGAGASSKQAEAQLEKQQDLELRLQVVENTVQGLSDVVFAERAAPPPFFAR